MSQNMQKGDKEVLYTKEIQIEKKDRKKVLQLLLSIFVIIFVISVIVIICYFKFLSETN